MWAMTVHVFCVLPKTCFFDKRPMHKCRKMKKNLPIGQLICEELRRQGKTNRWLAERINVNIRTVNKIFQKSVIDTQQLMLISESLGVDFFHPYSELLRHILTLSEAENASIE